MPKNFHSIELNSADATTHLAQWLAPQLRAGDVLLLSGGIGAGKTHFARALITTLLTETEEVPSPTFTIVQVYDAGTCEIWHADLYRIVAPDEVIELGLTDAFQNAICLVEWPDRLAELEPDNALSLDFSIQPVEGCRKLNASWHNSRWNQLLNNLKT
ncbi:tRNA (adenosine(37)-N6)-threonylcarbamoyltransferase complex ATPase subunit type 1 TsaE [Shimia abyssi]|uniref:tRNA threonylcarbamoyladenosine biosynthesis protein TsaE n=1 Tax=Shimia abyssi TaxID=1662395 RepID=A0A2P8F889_9RHOB|nr:tRNA (adenosine(37)-N6)-threonylcarbamoyltransferase complex ATPase subunit type 1 TsaE [Shimia abyssi]PSL17940.1 tRNA threonylcarbamoyladenosine biosynthesis protein TsaE [Shimia abyssi]